MKKIFVACCISSLLGSMGKYSAPVNRHWQLSGLDSTTVFAMTIHNGAIYAGSAGKGIYTSVDNGKSWSSGNAGLSNFFVRSLLSDGKYLFAGTKDGVFISKDNGSTWSPCSKGMEPGNTVFSLLAANGRLFAGVSGGVYRSADGGANWLLQNNGFQGQPYVYALALQSNVIFAGTQENSVMKSMDDGQTWVRCSTGIPPGMTISSFQVFNARSLMCGTDGAGCYTSNDQGSSWQLATNGISSDRFFGLTSGNDAVYCAALNKVFKSVNAGVSWTEITVTGLAPDVSINSILVMNKKIFIGTDNGIYSYEDD